MEDFRLLVLVGRDLVDTSLAFACSDWIVSASSQASSASQETNPGLPLTFDGLG